MSVQVGAHCLEKEQGGAGMLLGGVPGVPPAKVVVLGGGVSGTNAARMAVGLEASGHRHRPLAAAAERARPAVRPAAPHAVRHRRDDRARGAGGRSGDRRGAGAGRRGAEAGDARDGAARCGRARCWSTSRSTRAAASRPAGRRPTPSRPMSRTAWCTIASPTCRARWRAPRPSRSTTRRCRSCWRWPTRAGARRWRDDPHLRDGLNVHAGKVTHAAVARDLGLDYTPAEDVLVG